MSGLFSIVCDVFSAFAWVSQQIFPAGGLLSAVLYATILQTRQFPDPALDVILALVVFTVLWSYTPRIPTDCKHSIPTRAKSAYSAELALDTFMVLLSQWTLVILSQVSYLSCNYPNFTHRAICMILTWAFRTLIAVISSWFTLVFLEHRKRVPLYVMVCIIATQIYVVLGTNAIPIKAIMVLFMGPPLNWVRRVAWDLYISLCAKCHICGIDVMIPNPQRIVAISKCKYVGRNARAHLHWIFKWAAVIITILLVPPLRNHEAMRLLQSMWAANVPVNFLEHIDFSFLKTFYP